MATAINNTPPPRPQSPLSIDETMKLLRDQELRDNIGVCGRFTQFFIRNLALFLLLAVGLVALAALFREQILGIVHEKCRVHHDEYFGKMWVECQEPLRRAFGPRRPY